jgi:hypothetical protein
VPPAGYDRYIVACLAGKGSGGFMSGEGGTIGGNAATVVESTWNSNTTFAGTSMIIYGPYNTGTTANITFTNLANTVTYNRCYVHQILVPKANTTFSMTAHDLVREAKSGPNGTLDIPANGVGIFSACAINGGTPSQAASTLTERDQFDTDNNDYASSGGDYFEDEQTAMAVNISYSGSPAQQGCVWASWGP